MSEESVVKESLVRVLYDSHVSCRSDIDRMESAIRDARSTCASSDRLSLGANRCGILETAAYTGMRLSLLRWIADQEEETLETTTRTQLRCHIGSGISVQCSWDRPPRVRISWRHSDNDGTLPIAPTTSVQKNGKQPPAPGFEMGGGGDSDGDDDDGSAAAGGSVYKRSSGNNVFKKKRKV